MPACEHCWSQRDTDDDYYRVMQRALAEGWECTKDTPEGARMRAGLWWDEATQRDTRTALRTPEAP